MVPKFIMANGNLVKVRAGWPSSRALCIPERVLSHYSLTAVAVAFPWRAVRPNMGCSDRLLRIVLQM